MLTPISQSRRAPVAARGIASCARWGSDRHSHRFQRAGDHAFRGDAGWQIEDLPTFRNGEDLVAMATTLSGTNGDAHPR